MRTPVIGVTADTDRIENRFDVRSAGERSLRAIAEVANALPLDLPALPEVTDLAAPLAVVDRVVLTGARINVHPTHSGVASDPAHEACDQNRDAVALPLTRTCVEREIPMLGI